MATTDTHSLLPITGKEYTFQHKFLAMNDEAQTKILETLRGNRPIAVGAWTVVLDVKGKKKACGCLMMDGYPVNLKWMRSLWKQFDGEWNAHVNYKSLLAEFYDFDFDTYYYSNSVIDEMAEAFDDFAGQLNMYFVPGQPNQDHKYSTPHPGWMLQPVKTGKYDKRHRMLYKLEWVHCESIKVLTEDGRKRALYLLEMAYENGYAGSSVADSDPEDDYDPEFD